MLLTVYPSSLYSSLQNSSFHPLVKEHITNMRHKGKVIKHTHVKTHLKNTLFDSIYQQIKSTVPISNTSSVIIRNGNNLVSRKRFGF